MGRNSQNNDFPNGNKEMQTESTDNENSNLNLNGVLKNELRKYKNSSVVRLSSRFLIHSPWQKWNEIKQMDNFLKLNMK